MAKRTFWRNLAWIAVLFSPSWAMALTDSRVTIQGKVGDFDQKTVTIQTEKGPAKIQRSVLGSERRLKPGNTLEIQVELADLLVLNPPQKK